MTSPHSRTSPGEACFLGLYGQQERVCKHIAQHKSDMLRCSISHSCMYVLSKFCLSYLPGQLGVDRLLVPHKESLTQRT